MSMGGKSENGYAEQGMSYGLVFGVVAATVLYSITRDPIYYSLLGLGLAIGYAIGWHLDSEKKAH